MEYTKGEWEVISASFTKNGVAFEVLMPKQEINIANAHLISAAPLGYELADAVLNANLGDYDDFLELRELAKKFKAKAEGK